MLTFRSRVATVPSRRDKRRTKTTAANAKAAE